ncbi:MAG: hotdog fold thioesterase [Steroidobacteraceae bacterium]
MSERPARIWQTGVTLAHLQERSRDTLVSHLGIELTDLGDDYLAATMPVDGRTCQPMRILHGGASLALAESLGSFAANAVVDNSLYACVGQEINANHLRPVPVGQRVLGIARAFHIGARSHVWGIEIRDERGQLICVSRITMAVVTRPG